MPIQNKKQDIKKESLHFGMLFQEELTVNAITDPLDS